MIIKDINSLKALSNRENHSCFGCSPNNSHGLKMKFHADPYHVYSVVTVPQHLCGWDNLVHGGILATICDEIMGWSVLYLLRKVVLTKRISIDFIRPVLIGEELQVMGYVEDRISERETRMRGEIYNSSDELCAVSSGLFALYELDALKKKNLISEEMIENFENILKSFE